jgi:hypothetical protein
MPLLNDAAPVPPRLTANWPVKPGTKVRVLAVEVLILMVMLVSEVVATAMAGPVRPETEVTAAVKRLLGWSKVQVEPEQTMFQSVEGADEAKTMELPVVVPPPVKDVR